MKATYNGPEIAVEAFGVIFPRGTAVDVSASNAHAKAKLAAHPEFSVTGEGAQSPEPVRRARAQAPE
jgi:hypothetical protein